MVMLKVTSTVVESSTFVTVIVTRGGRLRRRRLPGVSPVDALRLRPPGSVLGALTAKAYPPTFAGEAAIEMSAWLWVSRVWSPGFATRKLPTVSLKVTVALSLSASVAVAVSWRCPRRSACRRSRRWSHRRRCRRLTADRIRERAMPPLACSVATVVAVLSSAVWSVTGASFSSGCVSPFELIA